MTRGPRDRFPTEDATGIHDPTALDGDDFDIGSILPPLDDHPGPARRVVSARSAAMVRAIMDAAMQPQLPQLPTLATLPAPGPEAPPPPGKVPDGTRPALRVDGDTPRRTRTRPRVVALLAAAMVITVVGGAAAAVFVARVLPESQPIPVPEIRVPAPRPAAKPAKKIEVEPPPVPQDADEDITLEEELEAELESLDMPAEVVSSPRRRSAVERELPDDAPPEDVLMLANQKRKEKRWRDADALYRRVIVRYKGTDAAIVSMVASAALHLERLDDPKGALRRYRRALRLRPSGALAEESRWGVAEALRLLEDTDAEAEALRAFLSSHPDSANAPAARQRLREIAPL